MRDDFVTQPGSPQRPFMHWGRLILRYRQTNRYLQTVERPYHLPPGPSDYAQNEAKLLQDRGDLDGALALHKQVERLCRELRNKEGLVWFID